MKIYAYIKKSNNQFPLHEGDIRLEHPEISEDLTGDFFPCPDTYIPVQYIDPPTIDSNKQYLELTPIQSGDVWVTQWIIKDLTEEEIVLIEKDRLRNMFK